ncbi:MAG: class I SAM-dependent methyltransferase [Lentisphaerae bacterium]|nr:class I SAM-dependent methyltransferase [Lentisphaerota bacterium]
MRKDVYRRETCRLCEAPSPACVVALKPTPIGDDYVAASRREDVQPMYPLDLCLCSRCGHLQLRDVVNPELLFRNYIYVTSSSLGLVEHFRKYAEDMRARQYLPPGAFVLEIGSNDGSLLRFFQQQGLRVLGVEPATAIGGRAKASGVDTRVEFFTSALAREVRQTHGAAHLVAANNVFAHADSLGDMADGIRDLLAPDGVFVFEVSYLVDIVQNMLFDTVYHEHLSYHAVKPFAAFFRKHGMELFDVQRIPSKGGSIRGFAQLAGGPRAVAPIVGELLQLEAGMGLDQPALYARWSADIDRRKRAVLDFLQARRAEGKTIAGYGASPTCTTLTYHFELGPLLDFVADDNPAKQGTFSPGLHTPVLASEALYDRRPDYVVILAWNYAEPILKRHQRFVAEGGHFVVPLLERRVI